MLKRKCLSCGFQMEKDWNFCPNCGAPSKKMQDTQINGIDIGKMMQQMVGPLINTIMGGSFQGQPQHKHGQNNPFEKRTESIEEVVEPEESVTEARGNTVHVISLPDVTSKSDIRIIKMENSVEVRAMSGKKLYLKIIKREKGEGVLSEEFSNGNLTIVLKKI